MIPFFITVNLTLHSKDSLNLYLRFHHSLLYSDDEIRPSNTFHLHWSIR